MGFVIAKDELVSFGVYKETVLNGLGYQFANKTRYEGVFKNGLLNGKGLKYQILQNKFVIGNFVDGNLKDMDDIDEDVSNGLPDLSEMKRAIHLRSMYFYNSFVQTSSLLKFTGYQETMAKFNPQQEYIYLKCSSRARLASKGPKPPIRTTRLISRPRVLCVRRGDR